MKSSRKKIEEILKMPQRELVEYLRETDNSLQPTDSIQIVPFEHGIKILYHHKDAQKPFKTKVYLRNVENSDTLK
ncbi:MAG: hypothetical protein KGH89_07615 [Thaumarchaeota archaeon]|nr:hypothetical protein [Nitrososphaerota archaeon]MDE1867861.1 hypothetical protein [Nitrososphaerota archaeon]